MGQRSVAGGETTARVLSGNRMASRVTTSLAVHSPGPVIGGAGLKLASSRSRISQGEGVASDFGAEDCSFGAISGRSRGSGGSVAAIALVASRRPVSQRKLAEKSL